MVAPLIAAMAPALISAAAGVGGSMLTSAGQASSNAANVQMQNQINSQQIASAQQQSALNQQMTDEGRRFALHQQDLTQQYNTAEADKARTFNSAEAATARDIQNQFAERMASTQYQRAMQDMYKAGLNPMLAYQQGGNASPSGSAAQASGPSASSSAVGAANLGSAGIPQLRATTVENERSDIGRALGNIVNSALDAMKTDAEIDETKERTKVHPAHKSELEERVRKSGFETTKMDAESGKIHADTDLTRTLERNARLTGVKTAAELADIQKYGTQYTPGWQERVTRTVQKSTEGSPGSGSVLDGTGIGQKALERMKPTHKVEPGSPEWKRRMGQ